MKLGLISSNLPDPNFGGGAVTTYSILLALKNISTDITLIILEKEKENSFLEDLYSNKGIKILYLKRKKNNNLFQRLTRKLLRFFIEFNGIYNYKYEKSSFKELEKFKVIIAYHWEAINFLSKLKNVYKIGLAGDPINKVVQFRELNKSRGTLVKPLTGYFYFIKNVFRNKKYNKDMINSLNRMNFAGLFAAHHAKELKKIGSKKCQYVHTPISVDLLDPNEYGRKNEKFNILMIGHLSGISTLEGINLFLDSIIPKLIKNLRNNFKVTVVGELKNADSLILNKLKKYSFISLLGKIDNLGQVYKDADLLLVPTPIELGIRVRILTAMMYGALIVAHKSNTSGIPELLDNYNCCIGADGEELASKIINIHNKKVDIKNLKKNARKTYEKYFSEKTFSDKFQKLLIEKNIIKIK